MGIKKFGRKANKGLSSFGRKVTNAAHKVDKGFHTVTQKVAEGAKKLDKGFDKAVDKAGDAVHVGKQIATGVDKFLDVANKVGLGAVPVIGQGLDVARGVSESLKRGLTQADDMRKKGELIRAEKNAYKDQVRMENKARNQQLKTLALEKGNERKKRLRDLHENLTGKYGKFTP